MEGAKCIQIKDFLLWNSRLKINSVWITLSPSDFYRYFNPSDYKIVHLIKQAINPLRPAEVINSSSPALLTRVPSTILLPQVCQPHPYPPLGLSRFFLFWGSDSCEPPVYFSACLWLVLSTCHASSIQLRTVSIFLVYQLAPLQLGYIKAGIRLLSLLG